MPISSPVPLDFPGAVQSRRRAGFLQGIMLLLPITMAVMGVSVLMPVVHLLLEHFKDVPNYEYLVMGGVVTMPSIRVLLRHGCWVSSHPILPRTPQCNRPRPSRLAL